jgi:hypothetical protein
MSKPTNLSSNNGCTPTSSSCVKWQGDDIDCIKVCAGDSLDEIIHELGCLLCRIKDQLDVDTYDLTCFNLAACDIPHTFRELMQFMLEVVCQVQEAYLTGSASGTEATGVETVMTVASCFQSEGLTQSLTDYVSAIGVKVCEQETLIQNQQQAILQMRQEIDALKA